MKRFIRYFCMYCVSRLIFSAVRSSAKPCKPGKPCTHVFGVLLFAGPFLTVLFFAGFYRWIITH
ncbi:MAG: hypothetical protein WB711_08325 [Terriglobales bacterium]